MDDTPKYTVQSDPITRSLLAIPEDSRYRPKVLAVYRSIGDYVDAVCAADENPDRENYGTQLSHEIGRGRYGFFDSGSFEEAVEQATTNKVDINKYIRPEQADVICNSLQRHMRGTALISSTAHRGEAVGTAITDDYRLTPRGRVLNRDRYMAGRPDCLYERQRREARIIRLLIPSGQTAAMEDGYLKARATYAVALCRHFERAGFSIEVDAYLNNAPRVLKMGPPHCHEGESMTVIVAIKRAQMPLDLSAIAYATGSKDFNRRIGFCLLENLPPEMVDMRCRAQIGHGYGHTNTMNTEVLRQAFRRESQHPLKWDYIIPVPPQFCTSDAVAEGCIKESLSRQGLNFSPEQEN